MESFIIVPCLLIISLILTQVSSQEGPGRVIAHPGQDVELLCTVTVTSTSQTTGWLVNNEGPYRRNSIHSGILTGYTATLDSNNLIVENIMMNDGRNGSEYRCVIVPAQGMVTFSNIIAESDPTFLYVAGIPAMVPGLTVNDNTIIINGNSITLTLSWGEPFNNLDPIVNYTVSCSGDVTCPSATTDNTTRSYTITNLTPMTSYTFSVVATNSIGSGEAGVVMITTPPGGIITTNTIAITSSMGMITTTSSIVMTSTSSMVMTSTSSMANITTIPSMDNITTTSSVGMTTTSTATSSVDMSTVTVTATVGMTDATTSGESGDVINISIIVFVIVLIILYCCLVFLFCYCCKRKARHYKDKDICDMSRKSLIMNVILGVFTFGLSIVVWYTYVKCKDSDKGDDKYCRIVHVSIIVLGIYTFGTSLLLWWLCTKLTKCCFSDEVKDDQKGVSNELTEADYVNKLAKLEYDDELDYEDVDVARDPVHYLRYPQGNYYANNNQRFGSTKTDQRSSAPQQTAADDVQWPVSTIVDQQMAETTAGGVPYAVFKGNPRSHDKTKNKKLKYADLDLQQPSTYENVDTSESVEYVQAKYIN